MKYLAPYVYRVAISNNRIEHFGDATVRFRYRESDAGALRRMTLSPMEFIRRFLQHVLPAGFHKVRYYGLLSPTKRKILKLLQNTLAAASVLEAILKVSEPEKPMGPRKSEVLLCPHCGAAMRLVKTIGGDRNRGPA